MSIGPTKIENFGIKATQKMAYAAHKTTTEFFRSPLFYLFYVMLSATVVALFFNRQFPLLYYVILGILAFVEAGRLVWQLDLGDKKDAGK